MQDETQRIARDVIERFRLYEFGTRGIRGMVTSHLNSGLSRPQVQAYASTRDVNQEFPGSRGFGYIERVPASQAESYIARAKADGAPDFSIRQLTPHDGERFVIRYIEPLENNRQAQGLDIGSESNRRNAAWKALQDNEAIITAPITLVQATGASLRSFLLLLPVYRPGAQIDTVPQREAAGLGWAYTPLVTDEVLAGMSLLGDRLRFSMKDVTDSPEGDVFFTQAHAAEAPVVAGLATSIQQQVLGRKWQIDFQAHRAFVDQLQLTPPESIGLIGGLVTALLASLQAMWMAGLQRRREVGKANALLAAIVENASDAVVSESLEGRILSWNRAAESLFGHPRQSVIAQPLADVLLPERRRQEERDLVQVASKHGATPPFETTRLHRDGHLIDVSMTVSSIHNEKGEVIGVAKLMRDISERKRHEQHLMVLNAELEHRVQERTQALNQTSRFLMTVLDTVPFMIAYAQPDLVYKVVNRAYARMQGVQAQDVIGKSMHELIDPEVLESIQPHIRSVLAGERQQFEITLPPRNGQAAIELFVQYLPDLDSQKVQGFYLIAQDITERNTQRRELEQALQEQGDERLRLQSIIQGTGAGTWESNIQTGELRVNEEWARLLGYTLAELQPITSATWEEHMHPEDLVTAKARITQHFDGELPHFETEVRMRHRNGDWVWVLSRGQLITRDAKGEPEWMYGTHLDINARKVAEESLRDSELFLERVGKVAGVGGWRLRLADQKITWTAQTRRISGVDDDFEPALDNALSFYPTEVRPALTAAIQATIDSGTPFDLEMPYITARGEHRWVRSVGEAEYDAEGEAIKPVALIGALMDFSERHEVAESLKHARREAEAANRAKSAFLANMSHEIRTPLNAVLGVFYLLADTRLDASQRQLLGKAQLAGRSLLGIVNDVLDLAKIESGELILTEEPYNLPDLLHEIESIYAPQATQKGVLLQVNVEEDLPEWLLGDAQRVRQVLTNLVGNAVKFTEVGHIGLIAKRTGSGASQMLRLSVQDTGIGIPTDAQASLFEPFVQADDTTTRRFGGTGLGLSIVRQLSEVMGGRAGLKSVPAEGSEFWVELPLKQASQNELSAPTGELEPLEIVVVDDNQSDRAAMVSLIRSMGWKAVELASGEALINHIAERIESDRPKPDALLVDWHMPGLNGLDALNALSQRVGIDSLPAALLVSVHDRERITDLHHTFVTDKILTKPLEVSALFNAISESIVEREGNTVKLLQNTRLTNLQAQWLSGVTVLLVDDGDINLEIAQRLLEKYSAKVYTATDGAQALEVLRDHRDEIDAVLMDIQMPVMDGLEATRRLRKDLGLTSLPVIALTAGALVQERERALAAGMNDFMSKPLEPEILIRTVRKHVEKSRQSLLPMVRALNPKKSNTQWPAVDGINADSAAVRLDNDVKLFLKMLGWIDTDFADISAFESPEQIARSLHDEASRNTLRERIHKLRGSAGTLGAEAVHARATLAEASLTKHSGDEIPRVLALGQALRHLIHASRPVIAAFEDRSASDAASSPPAEPAGQQALETLANLLRRQDLQALDMLNQMKGPLASALGTETFNAMSKAMDMLDFPRALVLLEKAFKF